MFYMLSNRLEKTAAELDLMFYYVKFNFCINVPTFSVLTSYTCE